MATGLLSAELAATCNAIGFYDGIKYHLEPHSKETIKDIIRYLRRDEDSHDIRRFLGNSKILKTDLLPILRCHSKDKELFDLILRLIVNLSTPALIVYNEIVPTDKSELNQYLQIVSHLQSYKEAFGDHKSWSVLSEQLSALLSKDIENRDDDDQRTIERILILVRNILHVPSDALTEGRPDNDASIHDQVIWALHQSSMLDLLLYMASSLQESAFFLHLLEIICLLVREQPPSLLAKTAAQRSSEEKHRDEEELLKLRLKEQQERQNKTRQYLGARHSNFGGTYVIKNMKSTSDNDLIYHKPLHKVNHFSLDTDKKKVKIPKNRQPLKCGNVERRSALSVRLILKQFCVEILNAAYNPLMRYIKDSLSRGKTQDNDESYYFTAMRFFMEFNRIYKFQVKLVSETMSVETFHFSQKYLETWHEMMITDKKKIALWSARMHLALKAYKELLQNLIAMDSSPDETVRESSKVIKSNIFYVVEYREMLLTLINTYKKSKYSYQYLVDLMETTHIFLKLLEKFCQNKKMVVQKPVRKQKKPKQKKNVQAGEQMLASEELWPQIEESLVNVLSSPITKEAIPFDAASEKSIEEQKIDAMKRIQMLLKSGDIEESVALFRSSREVWPENDCFGNANMSQEEELNCLKEVFLADLDLSGTLQKNNELIDEEIEDEEDEEEETVYPTLEEKTFDIMDLIKRFASPKVLGVCITLLSNFEKNSQFTNHCVAKMMHRIAWDCKLPSMLFQASLFRKFQLILESKDPALKELAGLAIYIIRKFIQVAETNKKVFMELLFFKNTKDAFEIECGYGSFQQKTKPSKQNWEEHEEDELRRLHEEYLNILPSQDMVEWITEQMISERSTRIVKKKMRELGLQILTKNKKGLTTSWNEEQDEELKDLYKELKDSHEGSDIIEKILGKLKLTRSRQNVAKALVRLGLAESTAEFSKKALKSGSSSKRTKKNDDTDSESSEEDDNDIVQESREEIRARDSIPDLYHTVRLMFTEKEINVYLTEGLKWLRSCMEDCLEDLDDDPTEVPLLPLSGEALLSVENADFKLFLSSLGIFKPLQQEIYWRFPAIWKETDFKSRQKLISLIIENESIDSCDEINPLIKEITGKEGSMNSDDSDDPDSMAAISVTPASAKKSLKPKKSKPKSKLQELKNKLFGKDKSDTSSKEKKPKKKTDRSSKNFLLEDLDGASTEDFNAMVTEQCREILRKEGVRDSSPDRNGHKLLKDFHSDSESEDSMLLPKRSKFVPDDSEDESSKETNTKVSRYNKKTKLLSTDSEDEGNIENPSSTYPKLTDSTAGDEKENKAPEKAKKSRFIESDSEDESSNETNSKVNTPSKSAKFREIDSEDELKKGNSLSIFPKLTDPMTDDDRENNDPIKSKKSRFIESDSEDESSNETNSKVNTPSKNSKFREADSDDELENPSSIFPELTNLMANDDRENNVPIKAKKSRFIESDSEDESSNETSRKVNISKSAEFQKTDTVDEVKKRNPSSIFPKLTDPMADDGRENKVPIKSKKSPFIESDSEDEPSNESNSKVNTPSMNAKFRKEDKQESSSVFPKLTDPMTDGRENSVQVKAMKSRFIQSDSEDESFNDERNAPSKNMEEIHASNEISSSNPKFIDSGDEGVTKNISPSNSSSNTVSNSATSTIKRARLTDSDSDDSSPAEVKKKRHIIESD